MRARDRRDGGVVPPTYALAGPAGIIRYVHLLAAYVGQYARGRMEYRGDLVAAIAGEALQQGATLAFLAVVFANVPALRGWSRPEVYVVYACFQLSWGFAEAWSGAAWSLGERYIVRGELDRLLTRPASPLFQLLLEGVAAEPATQVAAGVVILVWAARAAHIAWAWWMPGFLVVTLLSGGAIYVAVFISLSCLAFWVDGRTGIMPLVYNLTAYAQYPTSIYGRWLRVLFTALLPFAFTAFYPAAAVLRPHTYLAAGAAGPAVAAACLAVSWFVWSRGVHRYEGAGS